MAIRIMTVVGARPQFVKAAVVSRELAKDGYFNESIVHTGQHYDANMSQAFFDELGIPEPDINLGISGGTHAEMTAAMLVELERAMLREQPDMILLYGDTNSTLSGALAAAKLHIPIVHVEAGARTHSATNPEEINRICTDHVSSLLLACTTENLKNLKREGLGEKSFFVGDPMLDAFMTFSSRAVEPMLISLIDGSAVDLPERFYYLTCHREENTGSDDVLGSILRTAASFDFPTIYPVHPRVKKQAMSLLDEMGSDKVTLVEPVSYTESIYLTNHAEQVITDSGGLQREAFFAGVKCTTLLDFEVWPETMVGNRNILARPNRDSVLSAMGKQQHVDASYAPFGSGDASQKIVEMIKRYIKEN